MTPIFTVKVQRGAHRSDVTPLHINAHAVQAIGRTCGEHPRGAATIIYLTGGDSIEVLDSPEDVLAWWLERLEQAKGLAT